MERTVKLSVDNLSKINLDDFSDEEFAIAKMGFLSTRPNSHDLVISEEVLRKSAPSVLGKWLVADMAFGEPTTHTPNEHIVGRIPKSQEVEFVVDDDGYLRAYADVVISKVYAKDFYQAFEMSNNRAVSVEMKASTEEDDENVLTGFNIVGVTVLGKTVRPSCPQSDITFTRFSEDEADTFFATHKLSELEKFVNTRKIAMADEKKYKIDKSKEAMSNAPWGDVDKAAQRDKIMEASNRVTLVKSVYMLVEDGWEDAPSEHLKYPVMELKGDTFVYNRGALSSALAYAKQENEQSVINKVEAIYKKLDLDDSEGKEDKKMAEIEFAVVKIEYLWRQLYDAIHSKENWEYCIDAIYEENGQKFAILTDRAGVNFRLDFSLTVDGMVIADEVVKIEIEIVETDDVRRFAEVDDAELMAKYTTFEAEPESDPKDDEDEGEAKMSCDEMMAQIEQFKADIADRDNIIMEKEAELAELRQFKADRLEADKAMAVEQLMSSVEKFMDKETAATVRAEGMAVEFAELDAWKNRTKASVWDKMTANKKNEEEFTRMSAPVVETHKTKSTNIWERLKNKD